MTPLRASARRWTIVGTALMSVAVAQQRPAATAAIPGQPTTLAAHEGKVWSVAFSPDGQMLATAGEDKTIGLWDVGSGALRHRLTGHEGLVRSVAFSPDGRLLVSTGFDNTVRLWDAATGELARALRDTAHAFYPVFLPGGGTLVTGSGDTGARIWDLQTGDLTRTLSGHQGSAWAVALSPDGAVLATGSAGKTLKLWSSKSFELQADLTGHDSPVNSLSFSPDGTTLAAGNGDRYARLWHVETGELRASQMGQPGVVYDVGFSPDGRSLATACSDKRVRLWDVATTELQRSLIGGGYSLAFSRDGRYLASGGEDGAVSLWDWPGLTSDLESSRKRVDLRPNLARWGIHPRRQGRRGTCSVFVVMGTLEYALARKLDRGTHLSVEFLNWASNKALDRYGDGGFFHDILKGLDAYGICPEEQLPYRAEFDPKLEPGAQALETAREIRDRGFAVHWINPWKKEAGLTDEQMAQIKAVLDSGWPVAAGSHHSILLVGYIDDPAHPGGGIFIARDSAAGGYAEPTYAFVKEKVGDVFWVELPA